MREREGIFLKIHCGYSLVYPKENGGPYTGCLKASEAVVH